MFCTKTLLADLTVIERHYIFGGFTLRQCHKRFAE